MSNRWGWLTTAVVVAALAGCGSTETKENGGTPPAEAGTTPPADSGTPPADAGTTPPADSGTTPAPTNGGGTPTEGQPPAAAPASGPVTLQATWTGEGDAKMALVMSGTDEVAKLDPKNPAISEQVVSYLKAKREAMTAAGQKPKVTILVPADMPFEQVGQPLLKSAFRAGFRPNKDPEQNEVEYKPSTGAK